jgi:hypothetical protein
VKQPSQQDDRVQNLEKNCVRTFEKEKIKGTFQIWDTKTQKWDSELTWERDCE